MVAWRGTGLHHRYLAGDARRASLTIGLRGA